MVNDTRIDLKVPKVLYDEIKRVAESQHISMASLIKIACTDYINKANK